MVGGVKACYAVLLALVLGVGCAGGDEEAAPKTQAKTDAAPKAKSKPKVEAKRPEPPKETPEKLIADLIVEKAIREILDKPEGELTEADAAKVTELNLDDTEITDVGLKEVIKLKQLDSLKLEDTQITDVGLKDLTKLQKLEMLYLGYTQITDAGLKDLAKLKQLEELILR